MRSTLLALMVAAVLAVGPAAFAAPTCQDQNGVITRCGTPKAMPVGWTASEAQRAALNGSSDLNPTEWLALFAIVGGLFALIALMPRFDNAEGNRWDRQEGDD